MLNINALIGERYRLVQKLGAGAMGQVWLANDELLQRQVAIKQLHLNESQTSQTDFDRVAREARLASRLSHPNAVTIYDLILSDGFPLLIMEYVEGQTLADKIKNEGRLPQDQAASIISQVGSALGAAHAMGIIHRDVKPANILLTSTGQAKLADFGIARSETDTSLTATGMLLGTIAFMAPEIADGQQANSASDVWSLGVTLYTALEGAPPFRGESTVQILLRVVQGEIPPPQQAGQLTDLLQQCLNRNPDMRPSVSQIVEELHQLASNPNPARNEPSLPDEFTHIKPLGSSLGVPGPESFVDPTAIRESSPVVSLEIQTDSDQTVAKSRVARVPRPSNEADGSTIPLPVPEHNARSSQDTATVKRLALIFGGVLLSVALIAVLALIFVPKLGNSSSVASDKSPEVASDMPSNAANRPDRDKLLSALENNRLNSPGKGRTDADGLRTQYGYLSCVGNAIYESRLTDGQIESAINRMNGTWDIRDEIRDESAGQVWSEIAGLLLLECNEYFNPANDSAYSTEKRPYIAHSAAWLGTYYKGDKRWDAWCIAGHVADSSLTNKNIMEPYESKSNVPYVESSSLWPGFPDAEKFSKCKRG